jgi:hypothetical protein
MQVLSVEVVHAGRQLQGGRVDWGSGEDAKARSEGWGFFDINGRGMLQLQRDDAANILVDDLAAWDLVSKVDSPLHRMALARLELANRGEWLRVTMGPSVDLREVLVEGAGYRIHEAGTCVGWYALLPGQSWIRFSDENHNYLGLFSSKDDLLSEVSEMVGIRTANREGLTHEAWDAMHIDEKLSLVWLGQ